jgi:hypothetical protein
LDIANVLKTDKQNMIISSLAEGSTIRSIERITGVHRDTITKVYAWSSATGDPAKPHHVTVLHLRPITSAVHAVRAAIIQEFRSLEPAEEN